MMEKKMETTGIIGVTQGIIGSQKVIQYPVEVSLRCTINMRGTEDRNMGNDFGFYAIHLQYRVEPLCRAV